MDIMDRKFALQFFGEDGMGSTGDSGVPVGGTPGIDAPVSGLSGSENSIYDAPNSTDVDPAQAQPADGSQGDGTNQPALPAEYAEFTLPEGFDKSESYETQVGEFKTLAKELNLSQEQAQKLVDFHAKTWMGAIAEADERNSTLS